MKSIAIVLALSLAAFGLLLGAQTVDARGFCAGAVDDWCPGNVCVLRNGAWVCDTDLEPDCVREPCP